MCFSATASFTSGVVLAVIGSASLKNAKTVPQSLFAAIPLIFSVQQIIEGFLWLALTGKTFAAFEPYGTYLFIIIAQIIWPFWVPLSISLLEKNKLRKKIFITLTVTGACLSIAIIIFLTFNKIHAQIVSRHITYAMGFPTTMLIIGAILYFIVTIIPAFLSSVKNMRYFGILILASYIVTQLFYERYVISVWCFLGSIISVMIYFISRDIGKKTEFSQK